MNGLAKNINESTIVIAFLPVVTVGKKMIGLEGTYYPGNILGIIHSTNIHRAYSVPGSMRGERKQ